MDDSGAGGGLLTHAISALASAAAAIAATLKMSGKHRHSELVDAVREVGRAIERDGDQTREAIHGDGELTRRLLSEIRSDQRLLLDRVPRA